MGDEVAYKTGKHPTSTRSSSISIKLRLYRTVFTIQEGWTIYLAHTGIHWPVNMHPVSDWSFREIPVPSNYTWEISLP